jgi:hypothetical protein
MKLNLIKYFTFVVLFLNYAITVDAAGLSSQSKRAGRMELSFQTRYLNSMQVSTNKGVDVDLDSSIGWAFAFGYNHTKNWAFNFDIAWSDANYTGTFTDGNGDKRSYSNRLYSSTTNFGAIYHFSGKRFTPFIGATLGWAFVDSNIRDGSDEIYCSPFFPYYCYAYTPTKNSTEFTYGALVGLRFEASDSLFFKGSIGNQWIDLSQTTSTPDNIVYRLEIGFMF